MFALLRYTLFTSASLSRLLSKITIIDMRRFLYQGLGLHDVCHLELLDKPWLSDPLHLCSGNVSLPFVHHTLTFVIIFEMETSSLINHYCVHLKDNAQKLGLTAVQGSYLVGLIGKKCQKTSFFYFLHVSIQQLWFLSL